MLALKRQPEGPPAQIGRYVQDEALHVGQFNIANIPKNIYIFNNNNNNNNNISNTNNTYILHDYLKIFVFTFFKDFFFWPLLDGDSVD